VVETLLLGMQHLPPTLILATDPDLVIDAEAGMPPAQELLDQGLS
jgi:hypothetical protein